MARTVPEILAEIRRHTDRRPDISTQRAQTYRLADLAIELAGALKGAISTPAWVDDQDGDRWHLTGTGDNGAPEYQFDTLDRRPLDEVRDLYDVTAEGPAVLVIP
jgi:hypothetical protein